MTVCLVFSVDCFLTRSSCMSMFMMLQYHIVFMCALSLSLSLSLSLGLLQVPGYLPPPATLLLSSPLAHLKLDTRPAVVFWIQAAYDHVAITGVQQQEQQQQLHDNTTVEF